MDKWNWEFDYFFSWNVWGLGFQIVIEPLFSYGLNIILGPVIIQLDYEKDLMTIKDEEHT